MSSGHVPRQSGSQRRYRSLALTYVTFSPDGNELLANVGGEQIYLFDVTSARQPLKLQVPAKARPTSSNGFCSNGLHVRNGTTNGVTEALSQTLRTEEKKSKSRRPKLVFFHFLPHAPIFRSFCYSSASGFRLPANVEALKRRANELFTSESHAAAIAIYNEALQLVPDSAVLLSNRAAALMRRNWSVNL